MLWRFVRRYNLHEALPWSVMVAWVAEGRRSPPPPYRDPLAGVRLGSRTPPLFWGRELQKKGFGSI